MPCRLQPPTHRSTQLTPCPCPPQGSGPAAWAHSLFVCPQSLPLGLQVMGMLGMMACLRAAQGCWRCLASLMARVDVVGVQLSPITCMDAVGCLLAPLGLYRSLG